MNENNSKGQYIQTCSKDNLYIKTTWLFNGPPSTGPQGYTFRAIEAVYKDHPCIRTTFCCALDLVIYSNFCVIKQWLLFIWKRKTLPQSCIYTESITTSLLTLYCSGGWCDASCSMVSMICSICSLRVCPLVDIPPSCSANNAYIPGHERKPRYLLLGVTVMYSGTSHSGHSQQGIFSLMLPLQ